MFHFNYIFPTNKFFIFLQEKHIGNTWRVSIQIFPKEKYVVAWSASALASDETKVNYALSFLKGTALNWFEPYLLEGSNLPPPLFLSDYAAFCAELHANFGPLDPVGSVESKLETLRMRDDTDISKYIVTFNQLTTQVNWDSNALWHAFYHSLSDRIRDKIWPVGKPADLLGMKELAQNINARYWERKAEIARDAARNSNKSSGPAKSSSSKPSSDHQKSASSPSKPSTMGGLKFNPRLK